MQKLVLLILFIFSLTLVACGGGGGSSSESLASTSYTGERSPAYISTENAETLILGAYEGGLDSENIIPLSLETSTHTEIGIDDPYNLKTLVAQTLLLAQKNKQITMLGLFEPWELCSNYPNGKTTDTLKETNNGIEGDVNFSNCNVGEGLDDIYLDGKMTLSAVEEGGEFKLSMTTSPLYMDDGFEKYGLYGNIAATINEDDTTIGMTINMTLEEPSGGTYWLNNFKMDTFEKYDVTGEHLGTELAISGRYYSNDHGYVDFVNEEAIFIPYNALAPAYDGLIKFTGSNGSHASLWLGENQDDYCIKVFNDSGVVNIGTCVPQDAGGDIGSDTGGLNYEGSSTSLSYLYFENFGSYNNAYNFDLVIAPTSVDPEADFPSDGRYVYLEMFFPTNSVSPGTYTWSTSEAAGTFSDFSEITFIENPSTSFDPITGGTVTISQSGSNYIVSGNVTTTRGAATFTYEGPLTDNW